MAGNPTSLPGSSVGVQIHVKVVSHSLKEVRVSHFILQSHHSHCRKKEVGGDPPLLDRLTVTLLLTVLCSRPCGDPTLPWEHPSFSPPNGHRAIEWHPASVTARSWERSQATPLGLVVCRPPEQDIHRLFLEVGDLLQVAVILCCHLLELSFA